MIKAICSRECRTSAEEIITWIPELAQWLKINGSRVAVNGITWIRLAQPRLVGDNSTGAVAETGSTLMAMAKCLLVCRTSVATCTTWTARLALWLRTSGLRATANGITWVSQEPPPKDGITLSLAVVRTGITSTPMAL